MPIKYLTSLLPRLWANWITLLGSTITTISGFAILLLLALSLAGKDSNAYASAFLVLALPIIFLIGLFLMPIGLYIDRRRKRARGPGAPEDELEAAFHSAMHNASARRRIVFVALVTVANVILLSVAGEKTVAYMDSPRFCGTTCHTVMEPEWVQFNRSPHSALACVQCHIGPGAEAELKAKVNGIHQVYGVLSGHHGRPIPTPVENLRSSQYTCEQCHSAERVIGKRLKLFPHYKADKDNTPAWNAMLMNVGGDGKGAHWHARKDLEIRFESLDRARSKIGKITVVEGGRVTREFLPSKSDAKSLGERRMDCTDCHNRPTHIYDGTARDAVDHAISMGLLDGKIPWLEKAMVEVLAKPGIARDAADGKLFKAALVEAYKKYPDAKPGEADLTKAGDVAATLWRRNVYPEMNISWNTYRSNLGHAGADGESNGCFRCHDNDHAAKLADGTTKTLSQDCDMCHETLAFEEKPDAFDDTLKALLP